MATDKTHLQRFGGSIRHGQGTGEEPRGGAEQVHLGHLVQAAVLGVVSPVRRLHQQLFRRDPLQLPPGVTGHWWGGEGRSRSTGPPD